MVGSSTNGVVNGDELGPVGEGGFHVYLLDHVGDAVHELFAAQHPPALRHELSNRRSISGPFEDDIGDQSDALRMIQLETSCESPASDDRSESDQQLVPFPWHQVHIRLWTRAAFNTTKSSARGTDPVRTRRRSRGARCAGRVSAWSRASSRTAARRARQPAWPRRSTRARPPSPADRSAGSRGPSRNRRECRRRWSPLIARSGKGAETRRP